MIKILKSNLNAAAFSTESFTLYPLPARVADSLSIDEVSISEQLKESIRDDPIKADPAKITRLVLLVAQTCNIKCSYCFAEAYMDLHPESRVMSPATARAAIEKVFKTAPEVQSLVFFGGEPLIGFAAIREAVRASEKYCMAHQRLMPDFSISTNGTLIDQKMIEFFKKYHFSVSISLDGPPHINDRQRKLSSGKGTYYLVKKKIDLLRNAGVAFGIQAVFTDYHRECKEPVESIYEFLLNLGAREISLTPAIGGSPDEYFDQALLSDLEQSYISSTERIMDSWLTDSPIRIPYWLDILNTLTSRKGKARFCDAGCQGITVDCTGKVFPCHTVMSKSLYMGSVYDRDFPGEYFRRVTALMSQTSKDSFPKCVQCWAKKLCSPCYGDTFAACGSLNAPRESICTIIRAVTKATLLKVAEFMTNEEKWNRFIEKVNRSPEGFDTKYIK